MITHQILLRGAAQCFLLNSALHLTDVVRHKWWTQLKQHLKAEVFQLCVFSNISSQSSVTLDDVFSFLADFRADESLCRGTQIWNQVSGVKNP